MALYRFAGLFFEMNPRYDRLKKHSEKYKYIGDEIPEKVLNLDVPYDRIVKYSEEHPEFSHEDSEYIGTGSLFALRLILENGFVLHSSAVAYDGKAYLFSADSGTGKSTHTSLWQDVFGKDNAVIINDDKPAVREVDGVFYASGTPFSGKYDVSADVMVPLKALCFIHRSEKCEVKRLEPKETIDLLFRQMLCPKMEESIERILETLDRFLKNVPVYSMGVTLSPESARFAYGELSK